MNSPGTILLNGNSHCINGPMELASLLQTLGLAGKPVVVELNEHPVFPRDYAQTRVQDGDRLEVVTLAAGG